MTQLIGQDYPILVNDKFRLLTLPSEFDWFISHSALGATGYVNDKLATIDFIYAVPRKLRPLSPNAYDSKNRPLSYQIPDPMGERSYYSGIKVSIHYPPTAYRTATIYDRTFVFSDYTSNRYHGYTIFLSTRKETYRWETNNVIFKPEIDISRLCRDVNLWIVNTTG